jgi:hypothetical protein
MAIKFRVLFGVNAIDADVPSADATLDWIGGKMGNKPRYGVQILDDFPPEVRLAIDGYLVPNISATALSDGMVSLVLDRRFEIIASRDEVERWLWFVANAMAIGGGYSCFGENSIPIHPYRLQFTGINASDDVPNIDVTKTA